MNIFGILFLIATSAQLAPLSSPGPAKVLSDNEWKFGWTTDSTDNSLSYIIQLSPETAQAIANGNETGVTIPAYIRPYISRIIVRIGNGDVERVPSAAEMEAQYKADMAQQNASGGLTLQTTENKGRGGFADVDRDRNAADPLREVNQNNQSNVYTVPPLTQPGTLGQTRTDDNFKAAQQFERIASNPNTSSNPALSGRSQPTQDLSTPQLFNPPRENSFASNSNTSFNVSPPPNSNNLGNNRGSSIGANQNGFAGRQDQRSPTNYPSTSNQYGDTPPSLASAPTNYGNFGGNSQPSSPLRDQQYVSTPNGFGNTAYPDQQYNSRDYANASGSNGYSPNGQYNNQPNLGAQPQYSQSEIMRVANNLGGLPATSTTETAQANLLSQQTFETTLQARLAEKLRDETLKVEQKFKEELEVLKEKDAASRNVLAFFLLGFVMLSFYLGIQIKKLFEKYRNLLASTRSNILTH